MSTWGTITLAVLPAAVAVCGVLGATWMSNKNAADARKAAERADRRARGSAVIGKLQVLLLDMSPELISANVNGRGDAAMPGLLERWAALREELAIFAETDSIIVRDVARRLTVAIEGILNRLGGVLYDQKAHQGFGLEMLDAARGHYAEACSLIDRISDLVRDEGYRAARARRAARP